LPGVFFALVVDCASRWSQSADGEREVLGLMLISRHRKKAARLMQAFGELRPGYLEHDSGNHKGPDARYLRLRRRGKRTGEGTVGNVVPVTSRITRDRKSGRINVRVD